MKKPAFLEPSDTPTILGKVFGAPLVVMGRTGFPLFELVAWGILTWVVRRKHPAWSTPQQVFAGGVASCLTLGSEWCHNLAHAALAGWIGKPADAIRIFWGTPVLIYYDPDDSAVLPRQHLLRAIGGPLFSLLMVPITWLVKLLTPRASLSRYLASYALGVNSFITAASLLPIPDLDGGAILKWSLVDAGQSHDQADKTVVSVNRWMGTGLAAASGVAFNRHKKWIGAGLALFAAVSLAIGSGILKEHK